MDLDAIRTYNEQQQLEAEKAHQQLLDVTLSKGLREEIGGSSVATQQTFVTAIGVLLKFLKENGLKVNNPEEIADIKPVTDKVENLLKEINSQKADFTEVVNGLSTIGDALSQIPTTIKHEVEIKDRDYSDKFDELKKSFDNRKAPQVTVKPPNVKVDAPDLKPIEDAIKEHAPAKLPPKLDLSTYRAQDLDEMEKDVQYIGFTNLDGYWYILRNNLRKNEMRYKFGKDNYSTAWGLASTFRYKTLEEAINAIKT